MVVDTLSHVAATVVVVIAAGEGATVAEGAGVAADNRLVLHDV
jgi:hypothetical protein